MGQYANSVEEARKLKATESCSAALQPFFLLHYAYSLVLYIRATASFDEQLDLLAECAPQLRELLSLPLESAMKHKIYAQFLEAIQKCVLSTCLFNKLVFV